MSAAYVPQVGDTVCRYDWPPNESIVVTAVGRDRFLALFDSGTEVSYEIGGDWIKVVKPTPLPEQWINVYPGNIGWPAYSQGLTAEECAGDHRLAILHIWTDANGVDHADIERVSR